MEIKKYLGVNAHFLWFNPDVYIKQISALKALGIEKVRLDIHWDRHEEKKEIYDFRKLDEVMQTVYDSGLKALVYVVGSPAWASSAPANAQYPDKYPPKNPADYTDFLAVLIKRYPHVVAWQVWNEPNLAGFWQPEPSSEAYQKFYEFVFEKLGKIACICMAGMAYFSDMPKGRYMLLDLKNSHAFKSSAAISYHPYSPQPADMHYKQLSNMANATLKDAGASQIFATEFGWSSYAGPKEEQELISEDLQADYLLQRIALMMTQTFDKIFLFALSDLDARASARDRNYGLLRQDGTPKPAYIALQWFLSITGPDVSPAAAVEIKTAAAGLQSSTWAKANKTIVIFWSQNQQMITIKINQPALLHDQKTQTFNPVCPSADGVKLQAKTTMQILVF